ncbi:MAG TPA: hypothetical protein DCR93_17385, partial [Cytophagales bacterium]|nr:hypothetical protein [Cytophagales bacterium]HAP61185.1 hypothetical protein [Cytophagales bacterium]
MRIAAPRRNLPLQQTLLEIPLPTMIEEDVAVVAVVVATIKVANKSKKATPRQGSLLFLLLY